MIEAWYAIRVRSNFEQTAAMYLRSTGHDVFLPTYRERRRRTDRTTEIDVPLFDGYLFSRMNINRRLPVLQAPGVVSIVGVGKTFVPVPDEEIAAVRALVKSPAFARPCPYLNIGDRVVVHSGPLAGVEGILLEMKTEHRLVVSVHLLQRSVATEISLDAVRPVKQNFRTPVAMAANAASGSLHLRR